MEEESNPWPSFVDTFSSMLCIFIFIMLIFLLNNMLVVYESAIGGKSKVIYQKQADLIESKQENSLNALNKTQVKDSIQKTLMAQNEENGESLADIKKEISNQHDVLIDKTQEIQAEVESYKESFIPLLEKITFMYQKIVKKTLLTKRDNDENEK